MLTSGLAVVSGLHQPTHPVGVPMTSLTSPKSDPLNESPVKSLFQFPPRLPFASREILFLLGNLYLHHG